MAVGKETLSKFILVMRESKIQYNPALTVKENAKRNDVSEAAIRYYIKVNSLDRRYDRKQNIIADCRKYLKKHPKATKAEFTAKLGYGQSTIRKYWEYITTEKELTDFDSEKTKKRLLRQQNNFYATHPSVTQDILREETFHSKVLEPFCRTGTMAKVIEENGYEVKAYDIIDRGYGNVGDFFKVDYPKGKYDIISNPPYDNQLTELIKRCLSLCKNKVALLLPLRYLSGKARFAELYKKYPPKTIYTYIERIGIAKNADFEKYSDAGANMEIYAWYIWEKGYNGSTELKWIENMPYQSESDTVTILDGIKFTPYEKFNIPLKDCIQFHSKALPENKILSNHYDCIITFRGVEFYSLEQLFQGLTYSERPDILRVIMNCTSGAKSKSIVHKEYEEDRDSDFLQKQYRIIALCHLYKYLSVKEYRERLRETYPTTLVECPNGKDYEFGMVQNLETNIFEGCNCSGRTTMIVRDMMIKMEDEAIHSKETGIGRKLSISEREEVLQEVYDSVREKFDNDAQVIKDSEKLISFIEREGIPKIKARRPKPFVPPIKDTICKCIITDFDNTLFDTSIDRTLRRAKGEKDWEAIYALIPQYRLYDGWKDVFDWAKQKGVKIGVVSNASRELIERTLKHFDLQYDCVIGYRQFFEKPNPILMNFALEKLNVLPENVISVGDNLDDEIMSRASQMDFYGALWGSEEKDALKSKCKTLSNPREIIGLFGGIQQNIETPVAETEGQPVVSSSERVYGILGAVIGDIVGSRFEFLKTFPKYNFKMFGSANLFTDDTIMTVAIADALIHQKGFQEAMLEWGRKYPNGGWGGGFRKWLKSNNPQPYNSKGNGCGMRISPVGFYGNTLEEVLDLATKATMPTHGSEEGLKGAKAIASAIFLARQQKPKSEIKKYIEDNFGYNLDCTKEDIVNMVQHFEKGMGELAEYSVPVAIIAFLNGNDFEDTMRIAMTYGGDADTIGAMLGGISAAYYGVPMNIAQEAIKYLSQDILDVINEFDKTSFVSPRITPSNTLEWNTDCVVVYGRSVNDVENGEDGSYDVHNTRNRHKIEGYAIRTIGADFKETKQDVEAFVQYVEEHPQKTFLVKRVGIQKANIPVERIAPLFKPLKNTTNVFLPTEFRQHLENDN